MADYIPPSPHPIFTTPSVRQMILEEVVRDERGVVLYDEVRKCRLVCHDWLDTVTEVLCKFKKPLRFHLKFDKDHYLKGTEYYYKKKMKLDFGQIATAPYPHIEIKVEESHFWPATAKRNKDFGQQLGALANDLVSLEAYVTPESSRLLCPVDVLPVLQSVKIALDPDSQATVSLPLQSVLDKCPKLGNLQLTTSTKGFYRSGMLPQDFGKAVFPQTLTDLSLHLVLTTQDLEVLARNKLPNLKNLSLVVIQQEPFGDGAVFKVLENLRTSLKSLSVKGTRHQVNAEMPHAYFRFPVMEKLIRLQLYSPHLELEAGVQSLETFLPKLNYLGLVYQSEGMLSKWIHSNTELASVTDLYIDTCDKEFDGDDPNHYVNLSSHVMRDVIRTFPNVKKLRIAFKHREFDVLKTVFWEMPTLTQLVVMLQYDSRGKAESDLWTCVLLGITQQQLRAYKKTKDLSVLEQRSDRLSSIRNLQRLETLWLYKDGEAVLRDTTRKPLLTGVVFKMALLWMPSLKNLTLEWKSWASPQMTKLWKDSGRKMFYTAC